MVQEERSKESAAAGPVEMQRQPSSNTHPLLQDNTKSSLLLSRFNADSSSLSLLLRCQRRQASLARNFGRSEDDGSEKGFDDPLLRKSSLHDPLSSPLANEDALSHTPRSSRRTEKNASDERAEAAAGEWDGYKASIMQRFSSSGTIKVSTNLDIISKEPKGSRPLKPCLADRVTYMHVDPIEGSLKIPRRMQRRFTGKPDNPTAKPKLSPMILFGPKTSRTSLTKPNNRNFSSRQVE